MNSIYKIIYIIVKWAVGGLFIFSGLIKINDPVGTAIKLEEYFDIFSIEFAPFFAALIPYALALSIFLCILEVVLGVAILLEFKMKWTVWTLFITIVFFTFLTGYSAVTNKVTDCGCFGDAIKLTPWESFYKDIILMILITLLLAFSSFWDKKESSIKSGLVILSIIFSSIIAYIAIAYLPIIDFRDYKIGANIKKDMQPTGTLVYEYTMKKADGTTKKFTTYPQDKSWEYVSMQPLNPEVSPKITDFEIWDDEGSLTDSIFNGTHMFLILKKTAPLKDFDFSKILELKNNTINDGVNWFIMASDNKSKIEALRHDKQLDIPVVFADATVSKAIIRSNPGLWLLKDGIVKGKWHYNNTPNKKDIEKALSE